MSGICEIFPDDESCQVQDEPVDEGIEDVDPVDEEEVEDQVEDEIEAETTKVEDVDEDDHYGSGAGKGEYSAAAFRALCDWMKVKRYSEFAAYDTMRANLALATASFTWASYSALNVFRYRSSSTYYDSYKITGETEWYKLAS